MSAICLIDTSIFAEILNIPGKSDFHDEIMLELEVKITAGELLFLPMAAIIETGNHIAQCDSGSDRRKCAVDFAQQVRKALAGESPFRPINFMNQEQLSQCLDEYPDCAMRGKGFGDLSIIHDFSKLTKQNPGRKVYVWALDGHLKTYCREARIG